MSGSKSEIVYEALPTDDPQSQVSPTSRALARSSAGEPRSASQTGSPEPSRRPGGAADGETD
ncbi:MAG: hypothetical protein R2700_15780 [Solirubrobacterales bacterium]